MGLALGCVCSRTLRVSKGWPTSVTDTPPVVLRRKEESRVDEERSGCV
jgi:hypothetical protein